MAGEGDRRLGEGARILVVDDDPVLREIATAKLTGDGHTIAQAGDGAQGWERFKSETFDLALVDLEMPEVDGFTLIEWIRADETLRYLPVIVVTSRDDDEAINRAFSAGANSFVTKPVIWPSLMHQVRYVWRASMNEQELRRAKDAAESASRIKGNFMSVMNHELRTPLNHIIGFAEVLQMQPEGPLGHASYLDYVNEIANGGRRLLSTMTDMMLFARSLAGELELNEGEYQISSILTEVRETIEPVAQSKGVWLGFKGLPGEQRVVCDLKLIGRCLVGLLDNAIKFSPAGGEVTVEGHFPPAGGMDFRVIDQGPGMTEEQIAHCHEPFVQSDMSIRRSVEGIGLGLTIARTLIGLHGGELALHSGEGQGTTAVLHLPAERVLMRDQAAQPRAALAAS